MWSIYVNFYSWKRMMLKIVSGDNSHLFEMNFFLDKGNHTNFTLLNLRTKDAVHTLHTFKFYKKRKDKRKLLVLEMNTSWKRTFAKTIANYWALMLPRRKPIWFGSAKIIAKWLTGPATARFLSPHISLLVLYLYTAVAQPAKNFGGPQLRGAHFLYSSHIYIYIYIPVYNYSGL